ncbi:hypothetical protein K491DRAFT_508874 [Lophiostoma macrostomum CBS 122681]|uniref:Fungal N-terminal domain-containing protein n=1 Tax=Lophiostoma macrostomum CBS 122681 TaxID=1314788 RepID=A0A6A6T1R6_9PLEO|nr:hypothetical protein K491DRAFT_508874 [Lophiostoma macrostomum CBS 122681]
MDPLSIISGTLAVVGAAVKASQWMEQGWDLRHREQDFHALWNQAKTLRSVLWSMQISLEQVNRSCPDNGSVRDCLENIKVACDEAVQLFSTLNQDLQQVVPAKKFTGSSGSAKPVLGRWIRRKTRLTQTTSQTTAITTSLISALGTLRDVQTSIAAHETAARLEGLLQQVISDQAALQKIFPVTDPEMTSHEKQGGLIVHMHSIEDEQQTEEYESEEVFVSAPTSPTLLAPGTIDVPDPLQIDQPQSTHRAAISTDFNVTVCKKFCKCQCHVTARMQTPQWATLLIGQMAFYGNCSIFLNRRACNTKRCRKSGSTYMQLLYSTPSWASDFFRLYVRGESLRGFAVSMLRLIPDGSLIWHVINRGDVQKMRRMLSQRLASPYDVNQYGGSLLAVCSVWHETYSTVSNECLSACC